MTTLTHGGQRLADALAYLTPHPTTKGPVILDPAKMRASVSVIGAALDAPPAGGDGGLREAVRLDYTNHRGERKHYDIRPTGRFVTDETYHPGVPYLIEGVDVVRNVVRTFDPARIHAWNGAPVPAPARPDPREQATAGVGTSFGVSLEAIRRLLVRVADRRETDPDTRRTLYNASAALADYRDEAEAALADAPGRWQAWEETEADSDPSDPMCGYSTSWMVGWWHQGAPDADYAIRANGEAEARRLAASLNRLLTPDAALTQPDQTPEAAAPSGSVGEDDRPLILEACEPLPSVPTDYVLTCRWPDGSETVECVSEQAAALLGYRGQWIDGTLAAQQPAPQAPVADAAAWEGADLVTRLRSYPAAPPGCDPLGTAYVCALMEEAAAALTPPQAARPGDGEGWRKLAADEVEGIASQWDGDGRAYAMTIAAILRSEEQTDIPPADEDTKRIVDRAWKRFQAGVSALVQADAAEGRS